MDLFMQIVGFLQSSFSIRFFSFYSLVDFVFESFFLHGIKENHDSVPFHKINRGHEMYGQV